MFRLFYTELVIFLITLLLGIATAFRLIELIENNVVFAAGGDNFSTFSSIWELLLYFIFATLLIVFLLNVKKLKKGRIFFFRIVFYLVVFFGGIISLSPFLGDYAFFVLVALLLFFTLKPLVILHNICIMISIAGAGALIGLSFSPFQIAIFMVFLSFYDVIAVYKTKHMVKMAKEMISARSVIGIIVPLRFHDFFSNLRKTSFKNKFLVLGGGDIIIPLMFAVSFISQGSVYPFIILFFAALGLAFSFFIFCYLSRPIPALPPIVLFLLLGFLLIELQVFYHIGIL